MIGVATEDHCIEAKRAALTGSDPAFPDEILSIITGP